MLVIEWMQTRIFYIYTQVPDMKYTQHIYRYIIDVDFYYRIA